MIAVAKEVNESKIGVRQGSILSKDFFIFSPSFFINGSGFDRQSSDELKKEEEATPDILKVEPENLETRILTHNLSSSGLERGVIAETYQGAIDPNYIKGYLLTSTVPKFTILDINSPRVFYYADAKAISSFTSVDYTEKINYVHYVGSAQARVVYITEQAYQSYLNGEQATDDYASPPETRKYIEIPHVKLILSNQQEVYATDFTPQITTAYHRVYIPTQVAYLTPAIDTNFIKADTEFIEPASLVNLEAKDDYSIEVVVLELEIAEFSKAVLDEKNYLGDVQLPEQHSVTEGIGLNHAVLEVVSSNEFNGFILVPDYGIAVAQEGQQAYEIKALTSDSNYVPEINLSNMFKNVIPTASFDEGIKNQKKSEQTYNLRNFTSDEINIQEIVVPDLASNYVLQVLNVSVPEVRKSDIYNIEDYFKNEVNTFSGFLPISQENQELYKARPINLEENKIQTTPASIPIFVSDTNYVLEVNLSDVFREFVPTARVDGNLKSQEGQQAYEISRPVTQDYTLLVLDADVLPEVNRTVISQLEDNFISTFPQVRDYSVTPMPVVEPISENNESNIPVTFEEYSIQNPMVIDFTLNEYEEGYQTSNSLFSPILVQESKNFSQETHLNSYIVNIKTNRLYANNELELRLPDQFDADFLSIADLGDNFASVLPQVEVNNYSIPRMPEINIFIKAEDMELTRLTDSVNIEVKEVMPRFTQERLPADYSIETVPWLVITKFFPPELDKNNYLDNVQYLDSNSVFSTKPMLNAELMNGVNTSKTFEEYFIQNSLTELKSPSQFSNLEYTNTSLPHQTGVHFTDVVLESKGYTSLESKLIPTDNSFVVRARAIEQDFAEERYQLTGDPSVSVLSQDYKDFIPSNPYQDTTIITVKQNTSIPLVTAPVVNFGQEPNINSSNVLDITTNRIDSNAVYTQPELKLPNQLDVRLEFNRTVIPQLEESFLPTQAADYSVTPKHEVVSVDGHSKSKIPTIFEEYSIQNTTVIDPGPKGYSTLQPAQINTQVMNAFVPKLEGYTSLETYLIPTDDSFVFGARTVEQDNPPMLEKYQPIIKENSSLVLEQKAEDFALNPCTYQDITPTEQNAFVPQAPDPIMTVEFSQEINHSYNSVPYKLDSQEVTSTNQPSKPITQNSFSTETYLQVAPENNKTFTINNVPDDTSTHFITESIHIPYANLEYVENLLVDTKVMPNLDTILVEQSSQNQLLQTNLKPDYNSTSQNLTISHTDPTSNTLPPIESSMQSEYQENITSKPSDLVHNSPKDAIILESPRKDQIEHLEQKVKSNLCYTKPKLNDFDGFEEIKKDDYFDKEMTKQFCPVKPDLKEREDISFERDNVEHLEDKVELKVCPVRPNLKERFYVDSDTQVRWFSLFDAPVDITSQLVTNEEDYTIRVKGKDTDFERPFYESKSATYIIKANSGVAIVDKLIRQLGLNPVWEVEHEITDDKEISSGKVYLKDIMGVRNSTKELLEGVEPGNIDFIVRFYDKQTGEEELKSLEDVLLVQDIESERYKIDIVAQARINGSISQTRRQFKEEISKNYKTPVLEEITYREGLKRKEPLSGTGGIDEFVPEAGDIYDVVIASQGVYDRESKNIEGAYSTLKFKISKEDLRDSSNYIMTVKDKKGFDKIYLTKANKLSAILDKKLKEHGLKGIFVEIDTHKDGEGKVYQIGGELNNTTIYLAGVEGAITEFLEKNPDASPHEISVVIEKLKYSCGGADFDKYHNKEIYDQKREALKKAA